MLQWKKVKFRAFITAHHCYSDWRSSVRSTQGLYGCSNNNSEWLMPRKSPFIVSFCVTQILVFYCKLTWPVVRYTPSENRYHGLFPFLCTSGQTKGRCIFFSFFWFGFFFESSSKVIQWVSKKLKRKLVPLKGKTFRNMMSFSSIKCGADSHNWRGDQNPGTYHKNITSCPLWPEATWAFHYISASHGVLLITTLPYLKMIPTWL